jgi:hypothetical protein
MLNMEYDMVFIAKMVAAAAVLCELAQLRDCRSGEKLPSNAEWSAQLI